MPFDQERPREAEFQAVDNRRQIQAAFTRRSSKNQSIFIGTDSANQMARSAVLNMTVIETL